MGKRCGAKRNHPGDLRKSPKQTVSHCAVEVDKRLVGRRAKTVDARWEKDAEQRGITRET